MLFGGRSGEHEVSLRSAQFVLDSLDHTRYDVHPIGISKTGEWLLEADPMPLLENTVESDNTPLQVALRLPITQPDLAHIPRLNAKFDVIFPVMHGPYGEDGTIQGLLELADIAYVGSGVVGSALGMDKALQKSVLSNHDIPVTPWHMFTRHALNNNPAAIVSFVEEELGYPVFVKPCNLGSSVGITKVSNAADLPPALKLAATYDRRLIIERAVPNAREIEISVLGNEVPETSICGEIIPGEEFYSYNAKYADDRSREVIPADIPKALSESISDMAAKAFVAIDAAGFARIDFIVNGKTMDVVLNEINTIPGFTSISQFPKLWAASGVNNRTLVHRLIDLAIERHAERRQNVTTHS